jgi:hypothetical protein
VLFEGDIRFLDMISSFCELCKVEKGDGLGFSSICVRVFLMRFFFESVLSGRIFRRY